MKIYKNSKIIELEEDFHIEVQGMSKNHSDYFDSKYTGTALKIETLILSRARPNGIKNAATIMLQACTGIVAKRKPIKVKKMGDGYLVLDGNSTAFVLESVGCEFALAIIEK